MSNVPRIGERSGARRSAAEIDGCKRRRRRKIERCILGKLMGDEELKKMKMGLINSRKMKKQLDVINY